MPSRAFERDAINFFEEREGRGRRSEKDMERGEEREEEEEMRCNSYAFLSVT